ncbi:MAG: ATP-binding protein [Planctomycetota bacterium]|nr:ATP-binding protein [Planctomycetota bacterium]
MKELCENAMKARDEARQAGFELEWIERLLSTGFSSRKRLFRAFADFICGVRRGEDGEESGDEAKAVVSRCRVFLIDDSGAQIGYYQAGKHQIVDFPFPLGDDDEPLFNSMKEKLRPILAYVTGTSRKLKSGDEFSTRKMPVDYPQKDRVGDRTQWLELPVVVGRRVVAKIVVDHFSEPNDAFTLGEVRHLSRLVRSLSLAAETVELQRDRFNLSLVGQQYRFLWHHQFSTWDRLYFFAANNPSASRVEFQNRLEEIRKAQERLEAVFNTSSQQGGDPVSVDDDLTLAEEIMGPQITTKAPPKFPANKVNAEYPSSHRPLLQILLTLLANADNACQNESENYSTPASITVEAERVDGKLVISVEDTGCGVADKADQIREAFLEPASFLHEGLDGRKGLVYSAYLAQDLGWELHLASEHGPTRFELSLPVKGKVGAGGST